jgi:hypothetical protein
VQNPPEWRPSTVDAPFDSRRQDSDDWVSASAAQRFDYPVAYRPDSSTRIPPYQVIPDDEDASVSENSDLWVTMPNALRDMHDFDRYYRTPYYYFLREQEDDVDTSEEAYRSRDVRSQGTAHRSTRREYPEHPGDTDPEEGVRRVVDGPQHLRSREAAVNGQNLCEAVVRAVVDTFQNAGYLVTSRTQSGRRSRERAECCVCCVTGRPYAARDVRQETASTIHH